jgi:hypothetical protein
MIARFLWEHFSLGIYRQIWRSSPTIGGERHAREMMNFPFYSISSLVSFGYI